jgi:hypothetical protein
VEAGRLSALTAAIELGWIKRPASSGTSPNAGKRRAFVLHALRREGLFNATPHGGATPAQVAVEQMELTIGPGVMGSVFPDRESLRAAWEQSRVALLRRAAPGRRPQGWWEFDAPDGLTFPGIDRERSALWQAGVLSAEEQTILEAEWRDEFDRCMAHDFAIARPWPDSLLTGHAARAEHLAWADVPRELVERWSAERRRRRGGKRKQETPAQDPGSPVEAVTEAPTNPPEIRGD